MLRVRRELTEPEARHYLGQLLLAVQYLHDQANVLHRDVKLGNMMLTGDLTVKLGDFGLATDMGPGEYGQHISDRPLYVLSDCKKDNSFTEDGNNLRNSFTIKML